MNKFSLVVCLIAMVAGCTSAGVDDQDRASAPPDLVLVAGATGKTGGHVVDALLQEGYRVRAFVRDRAKAEGALPEGVDIAVGDVKDTAAVRAAMAGVTDVISAIGAPAASGPNRPEMVDYGGVKNLVDAAVAENVDQFVLVSSMGATREDHFLNQRFGDVLIWKLKGEDALRDSGLDYTVVRPGGLTDTTPRQKALRFDQGDRIESGMIPRADVAQICVAALSEPSARGKTFEVITEDGDAARDWSALFAGLRSD